MEVRIPEAYSLIAVYYFDSDSRKPIQLWFSPALGGDAEEAAEKIVEALMDGNEELARERAFHAGLYYLVVQPGGEETVVLVFTVA